MREIKDRGVSVRARLLTLSQASGKTFDLVLIRFAVERLLYRLSISQHAQRFVLKGAMLLITWLEEPHRATRDLDLLGFGDPSPNAMLSVFKEIAGADLDDGILFDANGLRVDRIREEAEYGGLRLRTTATIGGARVGVTIDVGFGDAIEPGIEEIEYPTMLEFPAPQLRGYARETVIAEKFQAMVALGRANSRMKDFYDIWILSRSFPFEDDRLPRAIAATFSRRGTAIPTEAPDALTAAFASDDQKQRQWRTFIRDVETDPGSLGAVIIQLAAFLMPRSRIAASLASRLRSRGR